MKLVALVAFKNEDLFLPILLRQLQTFCDLVIGHDDHSTDKSRSIFEDAGGLLIPHSRSCAWGSGGEYQIRKALLNHGRNLGGTHFVCLDADECFSKPGLNIIRKKVQSLRVGESLHLQWLNCWKIETQENSILYDPSKVSTKDFIFADDGVSDYREGSMHIPRTPFSSNSKIDFDVSVYHLQFLNYRDLILKQIQYQFFEFIENGYPTYYLDYKYRLSIDMPTEFAKDTGVDLGIELRSYDNKNLPDKRSEDLIDLAKGFDVSSLKELEMWKHEITHSLYKAIFKEDYVNPGLLEVFVSKLKLASFLARASISQIWNKP
jgi:hypothetical protein